MYSAITNKIKVSVLPQYQAAFSKPSENQYVFSYMVTIENLGEAEVQLLRRHWIITDGVGMVRDVEGEGVIGEQPVIVVGDSHVYSSWCPLSTPLGFMEGAFEMKNTETNELFFAEIPQFRLESPIVLN